MSKQQTYGVPVGDRIAFIGLWEFPEGKYANFATMHQTARDQLTTFMDAKARIEADERLTAKGKAEKLSVAVQEFETLRQRFQAGPVVDRLPQVQERLRALRGGKSRDPGDVAGAMFDRELRDWFRSLGPDERVKAIGQMTRGELPEVAGAVLRAPDALTGLRPDLRSQLEEIAVAPENVAEVSDLREEFEAIRLAESAWDKARAEIFGMAAGTEGVVEAETHQALEAEGLQKVEGKDHQVEPFEAPEVEPLPVGDDGVIDLKIKPGKSDAA